MIGCPEDDSMTLCSPEGALEAPIMGVSEDIALNLPPITMVFCCVDGGKAFASKFRGEAHEVHTIIAGIIRNTLRQASSVMRWPSTGPTIL